MAKHLALIVLVVLAGCQSSQDRLSTAKTVAAIARQEPAKPTLPASCTAMMERVKPKLGEPWVIFSHRWNVVADNRDQLAIDCQAEWDQYWTAYTRFINSEGTTK